MISEQFSSAMRTRVKICGFTRAEDAVVAARFGVDAIGLVFYEQSPRHVSIDQAISIVDALPAFVTIVALFVDEQPARIQEVLASVPVDCLQFHGDEAPDECRLYGKRYIKAIRMKDGIDLATVASRYHDAAGLLLDAYHPDAQGGTGHCFDWTKAQGQLPMPIILAGGLDVSNVNMALSTVQPYALDVSSGVEITKGVKDATKMAAFLAKVNQFAQDAHVRKL